MLSHAIVQVLWDGVEQMAGDNQVYARVLLAWAAASHLGISEKLVC